MAITDLLHHAEQAAPLVTATAAAAKIIVDAMSGRKRRRQEEQPEPEPAAPTASPGNFPWKESATALGAAVVAGFLVKRASRA